MSVRDELTGLFNRRYFQEALDREMSGADRYGHGLALCMIDLDHFKRVNDTHGHLVRRPGPSGVRAPVG
jgi:two-component system cell cycle response regulator